MIIGIAGPYSAPTEAERQKNLDRLNFFALELIKKGHTPVIGIHAALPITKHLPEDQRYETGMQISLAVIDACEALLFIGSSPGADRERDLVMGKGLAVYAFLEEVPNSF